MKKIKLNHNQVTKVDDDVYERLLQFKWQAEWHRNKFRARDRFKKPNGKVVFRPMSRYIYELKHGPIPVGMEIDHINGDSLDNRMENLRLATSSQNNMNKGKRRDNTTGFKGVSLFKRTGRYKTKIKVNGKEIYLGYFSTPQEAYKVYCEACLKYHGEFARLK